MLKFGNKEFRNLQEQVFKNMQDIHDIRVGQYVLDELGIKVIGEAPTAGAMPTVEDYKEDNPDWEYGDAYAVGTEPPYELYVLTRANSSHEDDYWFNIGRFPEPGPEGPEGPQGEEGPQGQTGPAGQDGVSPEFSVGTVSASTLSAGASATANVTQSGTSALPVLNFEFGIPQGVPGTTPSSIAWGNITGSIANQTDLLNELQAKQNVSGMSSYATQSWVGSNYLSSGTYIPSVSGTNDGTNWTTITIDNNTYGFAAAAEGAQWGSISGTLSNQTDLMSKFNDYATVSSLSSYATNSALSSAVSNISSTINSLDYLSVGALSSATVIPDITGLASESWVTSNFLSSGALSGYATETWVGNQGYLTSVSWDDIASKPTFASVATSGDYDDLLNKPTIPTDTSDLTNNAGFITSSALSGYATESYVQNQLSDYAKTSALSDYATISSLSSYATVSALSNYATTNALSSAVSNINSTIGSLNYLSVGALSSGTAIPSVTGTYDGDFWTGITINGTSKNIPSSLYFAKTNDMNVFRGANFFSSSVYLQSSTFCDNIYPSTSVYSSHNIGSSTSMFGSVYCKNLYTSNLYKTNGDSWLSDYATQSWVTSNYYSSAWIFSNYARLQAHNNFWGNQTFSGDMTLDPITAGANNNFVVNIPTSLNSTITTLNVYPSATNTYDLGSSGKRFKTLYARDIDCTSSITATSVYATKLYYDSTHGFNVSSIATSVDISSAISALDYASVGALSSNTFIPTISGLYNTSYWTSLTINGTTRNIPSVSYPVTDVQVDGTSVLDDTVAKINLSSALSPYALTSSLASVATSGSYNDLSNTPDLSGFITKDVNDLTYYTLTSSLASVATSGSYNDLQDKPTIPAAQVNADWNAVSGVAEILNKPTIPDAVSGTNDGTNWTSLTIGASTYSIPAGGSATDVQINGTSIVSAGVANILTNTAYNASTNKIATMSDLPSVPVTDVTVDGVSVVSSGTASITMPTIPTSLPVETLTTAPVEAYAGPGLKVVYLASEPATKYAGYIYMIAES